MTIAITGATLALGRLAVASLLTRVPASDVVAVVRDAAKAADLAERGVDVRVAPYEDPDALTAAFRGVDVLGFVSGSEPGKRVPQHRNVIDAAKAAGVGHVVYTSAPHADDTTLVLAPEHKATEELLAASGLTTTVLRNNWYTENYAQTVATAAATGEFASATDGGRVASAARADYAEGLAAVLADPAPYAGRVLELGGDVAWTHDELAAALSDVLGKPVTHHAVTPEQLDAALAGAGLDEGTRGFVVALDRNTAEGTLAEVTGELSKLLGRPTTPLLDTLRTLA